MGMKGWGADADGRKGFADCDGSKTGRWEGEHGVGGDGKQARWRPIADCHLVQMQIQIIHRLKLVKEKVGCVTELSQAFVVHSVIQNIQTKDIMNISWYVHHYFQSH